MECSAYFSLDGCTVYIWRCNQKRAFCAEQERYFNQRLEEMEKLVNNTIQAGEKRNVKI